MDKCPRCGSKVQVETYLSTRPGQPTRTMRRIRCLKTSYSGASGVPRQICPIVIEEVRKND